MKKTMLLFLIVQCSLTIDNCLCQWVQVSNGMGNLNVNAFTYSGNNIFAGTGDDYSGQGVYVTTNNGESWVQTSLTNPRSVTSLAVNGSYIFAGTTNYPPPYYGVFVSTNNGANWTQTSLVLLPVRELIVNGNYILAGLYNFGGVYKSTNNGLNWTQTPLNNGSVIAIAASGNYVFASYSGSGGYGVYKSTDNGTTWNITSLTPKGYDALAISGNNIYAGDGWPGSNTGVYISTDNGENWTQTSLNNRDINALEISGNYIIAGTNTFGVFISSDNGASWILGNDGLINLNVNKFFVFKNYIIAGTGAGVYRRPLNELTGAQTISNEIPHDFSLSQNYPNPFNPVTKIKFEIPNSNSETNTKTEIRIYDILGKEVAVLVNEELNPGTYEVSWDASNYSSGLYYYTLTVRQAGSSTGEFSETKKAVFIK